MPSSIATICITACEYGVPHVGGWLVQTMEVMFWVYIVTAYIASAGMYLILWSTQVGSSRTLPTCQERLFRATDFSRDFPHSHDDPYMGFPRVSASVNRAFRVNLDLLGCRGRPAGLNQPSSRGPCLGDSAEHWVSHQLSDHGRLSLSTHDAEAAPRHTETGYCRFSRQLARWIIPLITSAYSSSRSDLPGLPWRA